MAWRYSAALDDALERWAQLGGVLVSFYADEAHGVIDIGYLEDG